MQKLILLLVLCCAQQWLDAQSSRGVFDYSNAMQFMQDANGFPLYVRSDYEMEGTPFFSDDFCSATIRVRNGKKYDNIRAKVNLQESKVIYDMGDGKTMVANTPIEQIEFFNCADPSKSKTLQSGFPDIDRQGDSTFYLVLNSGKITLLKYIDVNYHDTKYYSKANTTRVFQQKEYYYIYQPGKGMMKLAKDNQSVLAVLSRKKDQVSKYIAANDIKCRREDDLVKVFAYYNSLD